MFIFRTIDNQDMRKTIIFLIFIITISLIIATGCTSNTEYQSPNTGSSSATVDPIVGIWTAPDVRSGNTFTLTVLPEQRFVLQTSEYNGEANGTWVRVSTNEYIMTISGVDTNISTLDYIYNPTSDTISFRENPSFYFTRSGKFYPTTSVVTQSSQSSSTFTILESHMERGEYGTVDVVGTAKNTGSSRISYGQINVKFYDTRGDLIGNGLANIDDLDPGETWSFKATYLGTEGTSVASYKIGVGTAF
jgi:hypothetical protein